ncbi:trypsin-like serine peptidase [Kitasatospora sp. NPDC051853]|uniref:trypsin-like serine peptidase n=1 Tax=Kitasatospora sp. NPDC051853 TaxID=3364058 RepID=UPI0037B0364C
MTLLTAALALAALATACVPGAAAPAGGDSTPSARTAPAGAAADRIGTLFVGGPDGARGCTASVVSSPSRSLLVTAAHCVESPLLGRRDDLVFAPGYRNGKLPHGSWPVEQVTLAPAWSEQADPEYDVAFLTVGEVDGRRIEDVLGGFPLGTDRGFGLAVTVTGYPVGAEEPITCTNRTGEQSPTQESFDCHGYTDGTSGSPWLTEAGEVVGVVGGYQEGGATERTSYSITFDHRVSELYRRATSA